MGKLYEAITPPLADWLGQQRMFFVATAPLAGDGLVNCSPKGTDSFRILGPNAVAYLDLTGSGVETISHLQENGRIVFTFCAFSNPPRIVRLHGTGEVLVPSTPVYDKLRLNFTDYPGARAIIYATLRRISDSCGFGVPLYDYVGERETLLRWAESKGVDGLKRYRHDNNRRSLDGLVGLESE